MDHYRVLNRRRRVVVVSPPAESAPALLRLVAFGTQINAEHLLHPIIGDTKNEASDDPNATNPGAPSCSTSASHVPQSRRHTTRPLHLPFMGPNTDPIHGTFGSDQIRSRSGMSSSASLMSSSSS